MENDFLYHYTSIDKLALILKNKTFRLSQLSSLDDLQEEKNQSIADFGQYCFVSSWVGNDKELIPMWKMYCHNGEGVRIKLKKDPFVLYRIDLHDKVELKPGWTSTENAVESCIPSDDYFNESYGPLSTDPKGLLIKVEYTSDESLLNPVLVKSDSEKFQIIVSPVGKYKNSYWIFQDEWRYRLWFLPISYITILQNCENVNLITQHLINGFLGHKKLPFTYYDLKIRDSAFETMEIMLSPDITEGNRIIVKALLEKYNPKAVNHISESCLKNLIR